MNIAGTNTNALNKMLKRVQHDRKKCVIPNLFRNLEFGNDNKSIAFALGRAGVPLTSNWIIALRSRAVLGFKSATSV